MLPEFTLTEAETRSFLETVPVTLLEENSFVVSYSNFDSLPVLEEESEYSQVIQQLRGLTEPFSESISIEIASRRLGDGRLRVSLPVFRFHEDRSDVVQNQLLTPQTLLVIDSEDQSVHYLATLPVPHSSAEIANVTADFWQNLQGKIFFNGQEISPPRENSWVIIQRTTDQNPESPNRLVSIIGGSVSHIFAGARVDSGANLREGPSTATPDVGDARQTDFVLVSDPDYIDIRERLTQQGISVIPEGPLVYTLTQRGEQAEKWRLVRKRDGGTAWIRDDVVGEIIWSVLQHAPDAPPSVPYGRAKVEGTIETERLGVGFGVQNGILDGSIIVNGREIQIDRLDYPTSDTMEFGMTVHNFSSGLRDIWVNGVVVGWERNQFIELERPGVGRYQSEVRPLIIAIPMKIQRGNVANFTGEAFLIRLIRAVGEKYAFSSDGRSWPPDLTEEEFMARINPGDRIHTQIAAFFILVGAANPDCDEACLQRGDILRKYNFTEADRMFDLYTRNQNIEGILTVGLSSQYASNPN